MHQKSGLTYVCYRHYLGCSIFNYNTKFAVGAEFDGFALFKRNQISIAVLFLGYPFKGTIVKDVAVLEDLDNRGALMLVSPTEHLHHVLAIHVVCACNE